MDGELDLESLDEVTAGFTDRKTEILQKLKTLRNDLKNPVNNEQDRMNIYAEMGMLEEELASFEAGKPRSM